MRYTRSAAVVKSRLHHEDPSVYEDHFDTLRRRLRHRETHRMLSTARRRRRLRISLYALCTLAASFTLYLFLR